MVTQSTAGRGQSIEPLFTGEDVERFHELVRKVPGFFRLKSGRASDILSEVREAVSTWRQVAEELGLSRDAQERMAPAFRLATTWS